MLGNNTRACRVMYAGSRSSRADHTQACTIRLDTAQGASKEKLFPKCCSPPQQDLRPPSLDVAAEPVAAQPARCHMMPADQHAVRV